MSLKENTDSPGASGRVMSDTVARGQQAAQREPRQQRETGHQQRSGQQRQAGHQREAGQQGDALTVAPARRSRAGRRWAALGIVVVVAAGVDQAWRMGAFSPAAATGTGQQGAPAPATAAVTRQDLSSTSPVNATLGYAGSYQVSGQGGGTLTWLPSAGQVITQGHALYRTGNGSPVALLYGSVPDWRPLSEGLSGQDVSQLNHDLVALGDAEAADISAAGWKYFSAATSAGVAKLESGLGVFSPPGSLSLGQVAFEPVALRVSQVSGKLGGPAAGPVLSATSVRHVVTIPLDAAQQSQVKKGDKVTVTLPDGTVTPGVVSAVGRVASSSGSGSSVTTTIPVQVKLADPAAAGTLDQAPVTVNLTTASARNALVVPVTALLAQASGGYDVEVAGAGNARHLVPVKTGIFDDADGLVEVTGELSPGERVVVPAS